MQIARACVACLDLEAEHQIIQMGSGTHKPNQYTLSAYCRPWLAFALGEASHAYMTVLLHATLRKHSVFLSLE